MDIEVMKAVALTGRHDQTAVALRLRAARRYANMSQAELADAVSRQKATISNIERGRSYPSIELMMYFWDGFRVDVNFIVAGQFAQLASDVQHGLFQELVEIVQTTDMLPDSHPTRAILRELRA